MTIALTGGIGSGKSLACKLFEQHGFYTINMDAISKDILNVGSNAYNKTIEAFGTDIINDDKSINRAMLKKIIFEDESKKTTLENIIHPEVRAVEKQLINNIRNTQPNKPIISESAIMIEAGIYKRYDLLIAVYADKETRINRTKQRDNISDELIEKIMATQVSEQEYVNYAQIILNNNSDLDNLSQEVERVSNVIHQLIHANKLNK